MAVTDVLLAITVLWGIVFIYAVMATMDFGAGFWSMVYMKREKTNATNVANRYLSPTWEVTNVFIVAIVVALVSFFPSATYTLGTVLLIPGSMILLLLAIRSAFLVFSHVAEEYKKPLTYISGITGLLIPGLLISILPITHGNFIDMVNGVEQLRLDLLFSSPQVFSFIGFAVTSTLFLSSLLLADYSNIVNEHEAYQIYRRDALWLGPISILMTVFIMITIRRDVPWLYTNLMDYFYWLIGSLIVFCLSFVALFLPSNLRSGVRGRPRIAVVAVVIQYLMASYAYGRAHLPYIVYPHVTIENGFTHPETFHALFATYIVGFIILFPGFVYFWKLFMKDVHYLRKTQKD